MCLLAHVGAQPVFLLFPTAPPRVLDGFVDTLLDVSGLDLEHPFLLRFYNPVAAMPSLHVAFAVVTGAEIADAQRLARLSGRSHGRTHRSSRRWSREPATTSCSTRSQEPPSAASRDGSRDRRAPRQSSQSPGLAGRRALPHAGNRLALLRADPSLR
jgi:hypothetical protein